MNGEDVCPAVLQSHICLKTEAVPVYEILCLFNQDEEMRHGDYKFGLDKVPQEQTIRLSEAISFHLVRGRGIRTRQSEAPFS
jgi:hypothetical protein